MKLYEVPNNSRIKVLNDIKVPPAAPPIESGEELKFIKIDGMYSLCKKDDGTICHLVAWADVVVIKE